MGFQVAIYPSVFPLKGKNMGQKLLDVDLLAVRSPGIIPSIISINRL
ncbi:hypothetical protein P4S72_30225 [Vibrio sp. PP-XX7]